MDESLLLAEAVARAWPDPPPAELSTVNADLLRLLRELEQGEPVNDQVRSLLATVPALARQVDDQIGQLRSAVRQSGSTDVAGHVEHVRQCLVELVYATNRKPTGQTAPQRWFGGDRGTPSTGLAAVRIPDDHRMSRLERPRPWSLRFDREVRQYVDITRLEPDQALDSILPQLVRRAPEPDVLVFVHGYNVSFEAAAHRAAQIAYDLDFNGVPMLYSWPSTGSATGYIADGETAEWSQPHFAAFLDSVLGTPGVGRVHVIAHSMGNRLLTDALVLLAADSARLGQVVFAAPDVDAGVFAHRAEQFTGHAERYTLYASDKDRALALSQRFARYPRAGQAGADITVVKGIDTIDATELDTGFMSHSYVGNHRSILADLYSLVRHGEAPGNRFGLQPVAGPSGVHWVFRR